MKLIQPPSYASLRSKLNDPRAKAGLPESPDAAAAEPLEPARPDASGLPPAPTPKAPMSPLAPAASPPRVDAAGAETASARKVYKFRVPVPVAAAGSEFAKLIEAYGEADAMGMILKSALDTWVANYGPESRLLNKPDYLTTGASFGTTRRFADALVADVRARIDPYDRRADGFIAQRIAISALSVYLRS